VVVLPVGMLTKDHLYVNESPSTSVEPLPSNCTVDVTVAV
jgi:hypothetical protein